MQSQETKCILRNAVLLAALLASILQPSCSKKHTLGDGGRRSAGDAKNPTDSESDKVASEAEKKQSEEEEESTSQEPEAPRTVMLPAGLTLVTTGSVECGGAVNTGLRSEHIRVVFQENPAKEAYISWTTATNTAANYVVFAKGTGEGGANYQYKVDAQMNGPYQEGGQFYHHAKLENLAPETAYYFVVVSDNQRSEEFNFKSAPSGESNIKFLSGGDSRSDPDQRLVMNRLMATLVTEQPDIIALLHGGDYVEDGGSWDEWDCWLINHQATVNAAKRMLPVIPGRGNHESSPEFLNELFASPGKGLQYYRVDIGTYTHFVLNSEISTEGDQAVWFEAELAKVSGKQRWISAGYHTPAYPAVKTPGAAKQGFVPIIDKYRLDMVFESDGHALKKTVPIRFDALDAKDGTIYVGEGGLGVPQRNAANADEWYFQNGGYAISGHHVQLVTMTPNEFTFSIVGETKTIDPALGFKLTPRAR
ncbi:MAG: fibronectin type III domain-containing protein [Oligoflexales bacterium]